MHSGPFTAPVLATLSLLAIATPACVPSGPLQVFNHVPAPTITSHHDAQPVTAYTTLTLQGTAADADDDDDRLEITWYVDGDPACADVRLDDDGVTTCLIDVDARTTYVDLEARDRYGATGVTAIVLHPFVNGEPTAKITYPLDGAEIVFGIQATFIAEVDDDRDLPDALDLQWDSDLDGVFGDAAADISGSAIASTNALREGPHTIRLHVTDADGVSVLDELDVTVVPCEITWFFDADGDHFGDPNVSVVHCDQPDGYVSNGDDCDDTDPVVYPTAGEICDDGIDNDCDGEMAVGCLGTRCFDDGTTALDSTYAKFFERLDAADSTGTAGAWFDDIEFEAIAGDAVGLHAWSGAFDTYVELYDPDCVLYAAADGGARDDNAFLQVPIPYDGIWTVVVTSATPGQTGDYVLEVLDDQATPGTHCFDDDDAIDLLSSPYAATFVEQLTKDDRNEGSKTLDDIEYFSFYGDTITLELVAADFDPWLTVADHDDCYYNLMTDSDSLDGWNARIVFETDMTGIHTIEAFNGPPSYDLGGYTLSAWASW